MTVVARRIRRLWDTAAAPALGEEPSISLRVSSADLDLSTSDGQAALKHRIRDAAWTLCRRRHFASTTEIWTARRCAQEATGDSYAAVLLATGKAGRKIPDRRPAQAGR